MVEKNDCRKRITSYTHQGPLRLISGHLVCRERIPLSSRKMKASFSVEGAFDTPLEKIRNASSLHVMTWGRRMKRSQQELPAYVSFSDSLNLRAFIRHGSGLGVSNLSPININSGFSVTENTLSSIWHAAEEVSVESRLQVCPSALLS